MTIFSELKSQIDTLENQIQILEELNKYEITEKIEVSIDGFNFRILNDNEEKTDFVQSSAKEVITESYNISKEIIDLKHEFISLDENTKNDLTKIFNIANSISKNCIKIIVNVNHNQIIDLNSKAKEIEDFYKEVSKLYSEKEYSNLINEFELIFGTIQEEIEIPENTPTKIVSKATEEEIEILLNTTFKNKKDLIIAFKKLHKNYHHSKKNIKSKYDHIFKYLNHITTKKHETPAISYSPNLEFLKYHYRELINALCGEIIYLEDRKINPNKDHINYFSEMDRIVSQP